MYRKLNGYGYKDKKKLVFLRFHLLYLCNMMRHLYTAQVRSWVDSQAKPYAGQFRLVKYLEP